MVTLVKNHAWAEMDSWLMIMDKDAEWVKIDLRVKMNSCTSD